MWFKKKKKKYFHWWYDGNIGIKSFCCCHLLLFLHQNTTPKLCCAWNWEKQQKKRWKSSLCLSFLPVVSGGGEEEKQEEEENVEFSTFHLLFPSSDTELISGKSLRKNKGGEDSSAAGCIVLVGWLSSVGFGIIGYYSFMIKPGAETWSSNIKSYRHVISLN